MHARGDPCPRSARPGYRAIGAALAVACLCGGPARAQQGTATDPELRDLMALLEDQTELATKTGMNADFIPGMATVLTGDDLLARGVRTVWEALGLVPGFTQSLEPTGERQVIARGVGFGYASGQIKVLLDGASMNASLAATANPVMNIPVEQIERIEVIRGPGASVYGEYAYAGVVNVITRQRQRRLHGQFQDGGMAGAGGIWYWRNAAGDLSLSLNTVGLGGDGGQLQVAEDALWPLGLAASSQAPGPANDSQRFGALFAELRWRSSFATVKLLDDAYGDQFGVNHILPPADGGLTSNQRNLVVELGQDLRLSERADARLRLEGLQYERERDRLYVVPAGFFGPAPITMDQDYRETRWLAAADLHWRPTDAHRLLFGLEANWVDVQRAGWDWRNLDFELPAEWLDTGRNRRILSGILQDEWRIGEHVTLTGGLRYDHYSDLADSWLSPRLAAVWRLNDQHIIKFQYAQAFRPPTFYELQYPSAGRLQASEIATYEVGYIRKQPTWEARLILFQSDLTGPISFDYERLDGYSNGPDARLRGVELEYQQRFGRRLRLDANLSYVDAVRTGSGDPLPGGTDLLANLALFLRVTPALTAVAQGRYVGERQRNFGDPRAPTAGFGGLDLTLTWQPPSTAWSLVAGLKNLTDTDQRLPESPTELTGIPMHYPADYPQPGRRWWLSLGRSF